ncbi:MAG: helix-turn-helix domain-containing protein [Spirochaetota bacterium]
MKSSKRSSASSTKNPDPPVSDVWLVGVDDYTRERIRLALESGTRRVVRIVDDARPLASHCNGDIPALIIRPASLVASDAGLPAAPPVLVYGSPSALDSIDDAVCDDVLVEPWTAQELRYRVRRLLRRSTVRCAAGELHFGRYWVSVDGDEAAHRVGISPVPREALQAVVPAHGPASRAVDMHLSRLRSRLAQAASNWPAPPTISCSRGRGYRLECR